MRVILIVAEEDDSRHPCRWTVRMKKDGGLPGIGCTLLAPLRGCLAGEEGKVRWRGIKMVKMKYREDKIWGRPTS